MSRRLNMPAGYLNNESALVGIVAGTTRTQAGATGLLNEINRIDTSTAPAAASTLGDGVVLPPAAAGFDLMVWNNTANPVQLYASGSDTINGVAGATGIIMPPNGIYILVAASPVSWGCDGPGAGAAGQYPTVTSQDALTAHAGGGQGSAVPIVAQLTRFTVVATGADSSILPNMKAGMASLTVINAGAAAMNVFPAVGETINGGAANAAFSVPAGKTANFVCPLNGASHALLSA
jgi:hypothetical protein